jgi:hypothetical protein
MIRIVVTHDIAAGKSVMIFSEFEGKKEIRRLAMELQRAPDFLSIPGYLNGIFPDAAKKELIAFLESE